MVDLTTSLLQKHYHYNIEEWTKQGQAVQFDSGKEQRIVGASIPSIELEISYRGLTWDEYEIMRKVYENNHSNTFILTLDDIVTEDSIYVQSDYSNDYVENTITKHIIDKRVQLMGIDASVWVFSEFRFTINAKERLFSGTIKLITSVFFNYAKYQNLFSQTSGYIISTTTNQDFINVLDYAQPYQIELKYYNNALVSSIGQSARHIKNKGGLKRAWTLTWILEESNFLKLLTLYRKKSGIMGEFGIPSFGTNAGLQSQYVLDDYIISVDDYVAFDGNLDNISNARFMQDSFKYQKNVNGFYSCQADIIEVKN